VKDAPVIFICENNQYAASTHVSLNMRTGTIAERAAAYGIPGITVDGMDVIAVYQSAQTAVDRARRGEGPTLLEYTCYRYMGHSRGDPGNYRQKAEMAFWQERDPIVHCRTLLLSRYEQPEENISQIEAECQSEVEDAVAFALSSPDADPQALFENVFTPQHGGDNVQP